MALVERERTVGDPHRQAVVAGDTADLLDDVLRDRDIGAHGRRRRDERVPIGRGLELQTPEDVEGLFRRDLDPHDARHVGEAHAHVHACPGSRIAVDDADELGPRMLAEQSHRARERERDQVGAQLPREPARRRAPG